MLSGYKKFAFCLGIGFVLFVMVNCIAMPESASAAMINIRDGNGHVTTWGWWLINIFAPWFIIFELVKIFLGILSLPLALFGFHWGFELLAGAWSNLTVMWPGLLFWGIISLSGDKQ
jgi:hypothetical protein